MRVQGCIGVVMFLMAVVASGWGVSASSPSPARATNAILHTRSIKPAFRSGFIANTLTKYRGGEYLASSSVLDGASAAKSFSRVLFAFVDPTIAGGLLSGGLHAISGPDHLAALIPSSVGKSGLAGMKIGALWGIGHGVSATLSGLSVFLLKGQFSDRFVVLEKLTTAAESIVGFSILFIGLMGVKESFESDNHSSHESATSTTNHLMNTSHGRFTRGRSYKAIFANGLLHGVSWDGAPSLAPAIAMTSVRGALTFLLAYSFGTIVTMSIASGVVSELSMRAGKISNDPELPRKLSFVSSILAVILGLYLTAKSFIIRKQ